MLLTILHVPPVGLEQSSKTLGNSQSQSSAVLQAVLAAPEDADLLRIIESWDSLSQKTKTLILAVIEAE